MVLVLVLLLNPSQNENTFLRQGCESDKDRENDAPNAPTLSSSSPSIVAFECKIDLPPTKPKMTPSKYDTPVCVSESEP